MYIHSSNSHEAPSTYEQSSTNIMPHACTCTYSSSWRKTSDNKWWWVCIIPRLQPRLATPRSAFSAVLAERGVATRDYGSHRMKGRRARGDNLALEWKMGIWLLGRRIHVELNTSTACFYRRFCNLLAFIVLPRGIMCFLNLAHILCKQSHAQPRAKKYRLGMRLLCKGIAS